MPVSGRCLYCRCTDAQACDFGCSWVDTRRTICSACEWFKGKTLPHVREILTAASVLPPRNKSAAAFTAAVITFRTILEEFETLGLFLVTRPS
jgi:hypothetical protein